MDNEKREKPCEIGRNLNRECNQVSQGIWFDASVLTASICRYIVSAFNDIASNFPERSQL